MRRWSQSKEEIMNGKGGCCIAKYGGERVYGMSQVDKIMLKFRPIAPKPVTTGSGSGGSPTNSSDAYVKCVRTKRKYVTVKKEKKNDNSKKHTGEKVKAKAKAKVVTLPLLPETPDHKEHQPVKTGCPDLLSPVICENNNNKNIYDMNITNFQKCITYKKLSSGPVWLNFSNHDQVKVDVKPTRLPKVVSCVMVESVTDTCVDLDLLGRTDKEIMMNLEKDACPGFISDVQERVVWTNKAYKRMAEDNNVAVVLVRKDKWLQYPVTYPVFTCKVRVTFGEAHNVSSLTLPCDVWRMERGSYAWRLDVKAALSLGR